MTNSQELLHLWFQLECIGFDGQMRLYRVPGSTCDDIEYVVGVKRFGEVLTSCGAFVRSDIPPKVTQELWEQMRDDVLENEEGVWEVLTRNGFPRNELRREVTYTFDRIPSILTQDVGHEDLGEGTLQVTIDGKVVSRAWSVRSSDRAEEVAVETHGDFRRRGYGKQVVTQWVRGVFDRRKIPIYSHRKGNLESAALARSVGAIPFVEVVSYH